MNDDHTPGHPSEPLREALRKLVDRDLAYLSGTVMGNQISMEDVTAARAALATSVQAKDLHKCPHCSGQLSYRVMTAAEWHRLKALREYFTANEAFMEHEDGDIAPKIREYEKARDAVKGVLRE